MSQEPTVGALVADREIQIAELQSTLDSLAAMVRVLRRIGGYLEHEDQVGPVMVRALRQTVTLDTLALLV